MTEEPGGAVRAILVSVNGGEWPVEIVRELNLGNHRDLVVRWLGLRPLSALSAVDDCSTICPKQLQEVRYETAPTCWCGRAVGHVGSNICAEVRPKDRLPAVSHEPGEQR